MILRVRIRLETDYSSGAPALAHRARLMPRPRAGQRVLEAALAITPEPDERREGIDFFANAWTAYAVRGGRRAVQVALDARVDVQDRASRAAGAGAPWEEVAAAALASRDLGPEGPAHGLFASPRLEPTAALTAYAAPSFPAGAPIAQGLRHFAARIHADMAYDPTATGVETRPEAALAGRRGVCQDFAQIMIAGLRGLGLPAMYVSGVIRTLPPPGAQRLEGADGMHAWVRAWAGPELGWLEIDPTNAMDAGADHVVIALGRDYGDVAPIDGVIVTAGRQESRLTVDVAPDRGDGGMP